MSRVIGFSPFGKPSNLTLLTRLSTSIVDLGECSEEQLEKCDAFVFWGGTDVSPSLYNQGSHPKTEVQAIDGPTRRDFIEWHLLKKAQELDIPVIGVCRGGQLMTVFAGGSLIQHVEGHMSGHGLITNTGLSIYAPANHHQMMNPLGVEHELLAWSEKMGAIYEDDKQMFVDNGYNTLEKPIDPEVIWYPEIRGLAIQPHFEWGPSDTTFCRWVSEMILNYCFKK